MNSITQFPTNQIFSNNIVDYLHIFPLGSYGLGREAETIQSSFTEAVTHLTLPYSMQTSIKKFSNLTATWKEETKMLSSISQIILNPAYQEIIGMGQKVLPYILISLENEPDHWFWALKSISGIDPVMPSDRGNVKKMTEAWIKWGKENGYI